MTRPLANPHARQLVHNVEEIRSSLNGGISSVKRCQYGQFMTPLPIACFMASLFRTRRSIVRVLDPGAGFGSLTAAFVARMLDRTPRPERIETTAFEIDDTLISPLNQVLSLCKQACEATGIVLTTAVFQQDYIASSAYETPTGLFRGAEGLYDCAILNPPYGKIRTTSDARRNLRKAGIETSNIYAGFMALAAQQLRRDGEFVSITPRSFCNGLYFRRFRQSFLATMSLRHVHVFDSRKEAFKDDQVLQETVIVYATKSPKPPDSVVLSVSEKPQAEMHARNVPYEVVIRPEDPQQFVHLVADEEGEKAVRYVSQLPAHLSTLGIEVSTGRVVDFRARRHLRAQPGSSTAPLVYPAHFAGGRISWPNGHTKKPNAIEMNKDTADLLVPPGVYVLVKRFTAKEERRRVVAAVYDSADGAQGPVGFENHLNYFHRAGQGLPTDLAKGLSLFLNSTVADICFRQFSGHTQVNALDLRILRYPSKQQLLAIASKGPQDTTSQQAIDAVVEHVLAASR